MDWATFLGGILGATFGSVITGIVSFKITNKTIKADLKKTEQEIKSKFYIEVTAQSKQDWLDLLREKIAKLASTTLQINLYSYDSNKNIVDNMKVFSDLVSIFDFHQAFIKLMLIDENNENYDFNELINSMNIIEMNIPYLAKILPQLYSNKINNTESVLLLKNKRNINLEIHKQVLSVINIGKMILKKETNKKEDIMKSITQSL